MALARDEVAFDAGLLSTPKVAPFTGGDPSRPVDTLVRVLAVGPSVRGRSPRADAAAPVEPARAKIGCVVVARWRAIDLGLAAGGCERTQRHEDGTNGHQTLGTHRSTAASAP